MLLSEARTTLNFKKTRKNYNNIFSHHQLRMACILFWGKKIFIVSKQKNRQKIQKIDIYNIHKLYTK